jgi:hypothetical protein
VQLQHVLDVAAVDEVVDLAVRVAGDVGEQGRDWKTEKLQK